MEFRDFLDAEFKPNGIKTVRDPKIIEYFEDENYSIILNVLREKPMTVKELTKRYNEYVTEKGTKQRLPQQRILENLRTDKTMYRYIKELTKAKIIAPAGQRMVIGKTATEVLYARTAKIFYVNREPIEWWVTEEGRKTIDTIGGLIALILNKKPPSSNCLTKIIQKILEDNENEVFRIFDENKDEVTKLVYNIEGRETERGLFVINVLLAIINQDKYRKEINECLGI